jgi:hypothetical protein
MTKTNDWPRVPRGLNWAGERGNDRGDRIAFGTAFNDNVLSIPPLSAAGRPFGLFF